MNKMEAIRAAFKKHIGSKSPSKSAEAAKRFSSGILKKK